MIPTASENRSVKAREIGTWILRCNAVWILRCNAVWIALAMLGASAVMAPAFAETGRSVLVVLDASGSMNAQLSEGRTRLEAAKAAVGDVVGSLAPDTRLALRVYGHQSTPDKKNCEDSELVAGFAPLSQGKAALLDKVAGLKARGYTWSTRSGSASTQRPAASCSASPEFRKFSTF